MIQALPDNSAEALVSFGTPAQRITFVNIMQSAQRFRNMQCWRRLNVAADPAFGGAHCCQTTLNLKRR
jgi:hypothetical protein